MAAIDKIYGTKKEHDEFKLWAEINSPNILKYFYTWEGEWLSDEKYHPITNFPVKVDEWLFENCSLGWVVARIREQYSIPDDHYEL